MNVIYRHVAQLSQATCSSLFINKFGHFAIQIPSFGDSLNQGIFRKGIPLQVNLHRARGSSQYTKWGIGDKLLCGLHMAFLHIYASEID